MKTAIIVQARMTSTRLPGKVLKEVLGKPLLEYQVERLRQVGNADEIVIATTVNDSDEPIVALAHRLGVHVVRGSEHNVLSRYHDAATAIGADVVVRVTSDCPLIDPDVVEAVIADFVARHGECDFMATDLERSYPIGMDVEVFSFAALHDAFTEAVAEEELEHVTPFIYRRPGRYRLANHRGPDGIAHHRWTVDTPDDFVLVAHIFEALYPSNPHFRLADIVDLLARHPDWAAINAHVQQKTLSQ
jgi:spore coat polysaccharide biosynthesis protein SpsF